MAHILGTACRHERRHGVATTDDGGSLVVGDSAGDGEGALGEGRPLKDAKWAIPEDGVGLGDVALEERYGLGADIEGGRANRHLDALGHDTLFGRDGGGDDMVDR